MILKEKHTLYTKYNSNKIKCLTQNTVPSELEIFV